MKELAILRFVKGLAGSLPLVGDFITNVRSKHPATGDVRGLNAVTERVRRVVSERCVDVACAGQRRRADVYGCGVGCWYQPRTTVALDGSPASTCSSASVREPVVRLHTAFSRPPLSMSLRTRSLV